jgi:hypothetical protein
MNASSGPSPRGEHVARGGDLHGIRHAMRVIPLAAWPMQHEAAVGVHRPAAQNRLRGDVLAARLDIHLHQHVGQPHGKRLVHDDAERALVRVFADDGDSLRKIRIGERRHRDQQMIREARVAHAPSMGMRGSRLKEPWTLRPLQFARRRTATRRQTATPGTPAPARAEMDRTDSQA